MKVILLNNPLEFSVVPRIYPSISEDISLKLRNEITNEEIVPDFNFELSDKLKITMDFNNDFVSRNKYEIKILNSSNEIIYLGKMIILDENTNVQNYEYESQTNKRFEN